MNKIFKYFKPLKLFYSRNTVRYLSSKCNKCKDTCPKKVVNCPKPVNKCANNEKDSRCPPRYYCVQRFDEDEFDPEKLKRKLVHPFCMKQEKDFRPYRALFLFVCLPICVAAIVYLLYKEDDRKRLKFYPYEHLRLRSKEYPWDPVRTLFHNPRYNALPNGYEYEVPEEEEVDESDRGCCPP